MGFGINFTIDLKDNPFRAASPWGFHCGRRTGWQRLSWVGEGAIGPQKGASLSVTHSAQPRLGTGGWKEGWGADLEKAEPCSETDRLIAFIFMYGK